MFTRYGRLGASTRVRSLQYVPYLREAGVDVQVSALFDDPYLVRTYSQQRPNPGAVAWRYGRRMAFLALARSADLLWIEKELFPFLPSWIERASRWVNVRYIVDYDDALFHRYDNHKSPVVRRLLGKKIDAVMRSAVLVTAGNEYLAARAQAAGAAWVEIVPTVVDTTRYKLAEPRSTADRTPFRIGWVGTPVTAKYLEPVTGVIAQLQREGPVEFVVVGANEVNLPGVEATFVPWTEASEADLIASFDVGIMPLEDSPWERGKCGYKLIQYMAAGLPTVASPVGVNTSIVEEGRTGFLSANETEWLQALRRLRDDVVLRRAMGLAGRHRVECNFALDVVAPRVVRLVLEAAARPGGSRS